MVFFISCYLSRHPGVGKGQGEIMVFKVVHKLYIEECDEIWKGKYFAGFE
jgi:hypothetical protein